MGISELPLDFRMYTTLILIDIKELVEKQHSTGAYTSISMVLAKAYEFANGKDPLDSANNVTVVELVTWAKEIKASTDNLTSFEPIENFSTILKKLMLNIGLSIQNSVSKGASFPFTIGLINALNRGYWLNQGIILAPDFTIESPSTDLLKLLKWACDFKYTLKESDYETGITLN